MVDYSKITEEEVLNKESAMPTALKMVYESDSFGFELLKIANDSFFDENEAQELQMLVGLYMMGFMKEHDLSEEISRELYLDPEESDKMVEKIRDLIKAKSGTAGAPAMTHAYASPKTTFHPSSETRSFIPPKNDFLKPEFYGTPSPKQTPAQIKLDFNAEPRTKSVTTSPDIHPENVIDLKDLPR